MGCEGDAPAVLRILRHLPTKDSVRFPIVGLMLPTPLGAPASGRLVPGVSFCKRRLSRVLALRAFSCLWQRLSLALRLLRFAASYH